LTEEFRGSHISGEEAEGREVGAGIDRTGVFPVSARTVDRGGYHPPGRGTREGVTPISANFSHENSSV
jgi:hypothetical protein